MAPSCHPERSEGSRVMGAEMLRCAQHDKSVQHDKVAWCDKAHEQPAKGLTS
jgi:hypothetical protein